MAAARPYVIYGLKADFYDRMKLIGPFFASLCDAECYFLKHKHIFLDAVSVAIVQLDPIDSSHELIRVLSFSLKKLAQKRQATRFHFCPAWGCLSCDEAELR